MINCLDIIAVGIIYIGPIISGMIVSLTRFAVVRSAVQQCDLMKLVHQLAAVSLESQVDTGNFVIRRAYKQLVTGEVPSRRLKTVDPKTIGNGFIEPFAFFQICNT